MDYNDFDTFDIKRFIPKQPPVVGPRPLFPDQFFGIIVGGPGSGKTTVFKTSLMIPNALYKKFDLVLFISPYDIEGLDLKQDRLHNNLDIDWIEQSIIYFQERKEVNNVLVFLDDVVASMASMSRGGPDSEKLMNFIYNRRKMVKGVEISVIMSTQKFTALPAKFRATADFLTIFSIPNEDLKTIYEQHVMGSSFNTTRYIISSHFNKDRHNFIHMLLKPYKLFLNFEKPI